MPLGVVLYLRKSKRWMDEISFALRYGFLVGRFREETYLFEVAILLRKAGVAVAMTVFWADKTKAWAAAFFLVGSLVHLVHTKPYQSEFHNRLAVLVLVCVVGVLFGGLIADKNMRLTVIILGIVVNVLAIVVGNVLDILRLMREDKEAEANEFYAEPGFALNTQEHEGTEMTSHSMGGVQLSVDDSDGVLQSAGVSGVGTVDSVGVDTAIDSADCFSSVGGDGIGSTVVEVDAPQRPPRPARPIRPQR